MTISPKEVLQTLESTMAMKSGEWLEEQQLNKKELVLIDLRSRDMWEQSHISGSKQIPIQELPLKVESLIPDSDSVVLCICNGSIQSAMAVFYLRTEGYKNSYNLSGGFSAWMRNSRSVTSI
jgi:hydroxyacylglutathione hydrolase